MTTVIHAQRAHELEPGEFVWIDRTSKWGNPFYIGVNGSRADVIAKYEAWVRNQPQLMAALHELRGKILVCHCKPQACHGDVLVRLIEEQCGSCPEGVPKNECQNSKRPCGHHCNCSWEQDRCCWCGQMMEVL